MKLYIYSENTNRKGHIAGLDLDKDDVNGDMRIWGEGSEESLIAQAVQRLSNRYDKRPGGAGDSYEWLCARNVLAYLDGPEMEYSAAAGHYVAVEQEA